MCGRSSLTKTEKEIEARFNASFYSDELLRYNPLPNFNVAPTQMHPVIINEDQNQIHLFKWGLIPFWAKDHKMAYKMINTRVETLKEKTTFKKAMQTRRCIVPFDGYYEWKKTKDGKQPFRIVCTNAEIFSVAGLWAKWNSPEGETVHSFTLITQEPNTLMANIHNRMPAILLPEQEEIWLDHSILPDQALQLIEPYPDDFMKAYPVSKRVGNVRENDKELIEKIELES